MKLRHVTPAVNVPSILRDGLLPQRAKGKEEAVWFCTPGKVTWAILHTQRRHSVPLEEVAVLEVSVPRSWLTRARTGLWKCARRVESKRIQERGTAEGWAV